MNPVSLQPLPITEKFGMNSPACGFLEKYQISYISIILKKNEIEFIQNIKDNDLEVSEIVNYFNEIPLISEKELVQQQKDFEKFLSKQMR